MTREEAIKRIQQDLDVNKKYLSKEYKEALNMAIESLKVDVARWSSWNKTFEQSGIADLISRAEVLDIIAFKRKLANIDGRVLLDETVDRINALPSADRPSGEWKLASEELPQSVGSYIVTCKDEHGWVYVDYDYWTVADAFKYNRDKVTAWIPFPKPYCGADMRKEKNK